MKLLKQLQRIVLSFALMICATIALAGDAPNPLIFVHGGAGSASQFESQAMRFTSNGYAQDQLFAFEYDSSFRVETLTTVLARLDQFIADVRSKTGSEKVDIMGHSLGTYVLQTYLANPARALPIAHYINIDGYSSAVLPGNVPTLALWAEIGNGGSVAGANNVVIPGQTHVEAATSAESFAQMYLFLTGEEAATTEILPSVSKHITLAGRTTLFPMNVGVNGSVVEIYELDGTTGQRKKSFPAATFAIDASGNWGPFNAHRDEYYEFVIVREGQNHHVYKEPFLRDDHFVRLMTSPVGGGVGANMDVDPGQSNLVISRDREFWGEPTLGNDLLAINGQNVINAQNSPFSKRTTAIYLYDVDSDQQSDLTTPIPYFHSLPFITGNDLYIPASADASGRIRITITGRGEGGAMQVLNIPNWPSDTDRISVLFNDFVQGDSWAK